MSNTAYQGVVEKSRSKVWPNGTSYFFFLEGNDTMFKMGTKAPTFKEGAEISFEANEKGQVNWASIKSLSHRAPEVAAPATPTPAPVAQASVAPKSTAKPYTPGFTFKDLSIVRQVALKAAIEGANFLLSSGSYAIPKTKNKALSGYTDLVQELTDTFYADLSVEHAAGPVPETDSVDETPVSDVNTDEGFQE